MHKRLSVDYIRASRGILGVYDDLYNAITDYKNGEKLTYAKAMEARVLFLEPKLLIDYYRDHNDKLKGRRQHLVAIPGFSHKDIASKFQGFRNANPDLGPINGKELKTQAELAFIKEDLNWL